MECEQIASIHFNLSGKVVHAISSVINSRFSRDALISGGTPALPAGKLRELSRGRGGAMGLAHAYAVAGRRNKALTIVDELREKSGHEYVPAYEFAVIYIPLGENDHGFEWLEKAFSEHDPYMKELKVDPLLDSIRSDPRFTSLLRRMKLAT